jgi:hypothetical protein
MENLIFGAFATLDGYREGDAANLGRTVYDRCTVVALCSAKAQNPACTVALLTNAPMPEPFRSQLTQGGVEIWDCPFTTYRVPADTNWALAYYKLCAMAWVLENRNKVHHQFFSSNMTQFRRTGRVSGTAAMVATIMNICPIMRLDDKGAIKAYSKVRGKKKAVETTVDAMEQHAQGGRDYDQRCFVCHSRCPEDAALLITALEERFPHLKGKIRLCDIGTIIGSHSGPGTVAVFFLGDERPTMD